MKPKLQAQRKFAQGAYVPPAPPIERRAAAEPAPDNGPSSVEVNFISNTRASKILDSIAFSHPDAFGEHLAKIFTPNEPDPCTNDTKLENVLVQPFQLDLPIRPTTPKEIISIIKHMQDKKAPGFDMIDKKVLLELPKKGMHIHQPRVVLQRLDSSLQTAVKKSNKDPSKKQSNQRHNPAKSSRVLRSMRLSSDDDRPLTYHIQLKPSHATSTVSKRPRRKVATVKKDKDNLAVKRTIGRKTPIDKLFNRTTTPSLSLEIPSEQSSDEDFGRLYFSNSIDVPKRPRRKVATIKKHKDNLAVKPPTGRKTPVDNLAVKRTTGRKTPIDNLAVKPTTGRKTPVDNLAVKPTTGRKTPIDNLAVKRTTGRKTPIDNLAVKPPTGRKTPVVNLAVEPTIGRKTPIDNMAFEPTIGRKTPVDNFAVNPPIGRKSPIDNLAVQPPIGRKSPVANLFNRTTTPSLSLEIPSELSSDEDFGRLYFSDSIVDSDSNSPTQPTTSKSFTNEDITNTPSTSVEKNPGIITIAPIYYPTEEEFTDPLAYYEKIKPEASKFGVCKVVPPANFKPECNLSGLERVVAGGQYTARFLNRRGEGTRDLCAIRSYLSTHNVHFLRPPLVDGLELNLPKMYRTVQKYGGFSKVTQRKKWYKVAENMNLSKLTNPEKKLDQIYVKYLLPYDILTNKERNTIINKVEDRWQDAQRGLEKRARNPLHMRKVYYCESDESSDEGDLSEDETNLRKIILDEEECVKPGRLMTLATFRKVNNSAVQMFFPSGEPTVDAIEAVYWQTVEQAVDHVCVYTASVDTSDVGYGFTTDPTDPISQHAWNLKNVRNNDGNILRSLGAVVSTTVPILHFGMFFTTNCWHRDPHGLPWIEFLHNGKAKIWYGIPDTESEIFRRAVEKLCPTAVQNKPIWLPSDICMIPPSLLLAEGVTLTRITQEPGEYIFIFPKAYSSSICTGFSISESVYFAVQPWPETLPQVFKELRDSCEPMMFAPEQLLIAIAQDERVPLSLLRQIYSHLVSVVNEELKSRLALFKQGVPKIYIGRQGDSRPWNVSEQAECDVCRRPLFLSKVKVKLYHKALRKMCPQDAQQIREKLATITPPRPINLTLEIFVSDEELQDVLSTGKSKLT